MQYCLTLFRSTRHITRPTVLLYLGNVPCYGFPSSNLPFIVRTTSAHVITAIPLKPTAWVFFINPSFLLPYRKWLACIFTEQVKLRVMHICPFLLELCFDKPVLRELFRAVTHVYPSEHTEREHLLRRKVGTEIRCKIPSLGFG